MDDEYAAIMIMSSTCALSAFTVIACKILWPWRGEVKGLLAQCCHRFRRRAPEAEVAEVEQRVREECLKRHEKRAGTFLVLFSIPSAYFCMTVLVSTCLGSGKTRLLPLAIIQGNFFTKYALSFFPALLTPRVIDAVYLHSVATIIATLLTGPGGLVAWRVIRLVQFFFWGLFDLKPWLNAFGTLCLMLAEIAATVRMGMPVEPVILVAYVSALLTLIGIDSCVEQGIRFEIMAADSKSELTAIQTLLNSICDVVVQLDGHLRLKQHSPKLANVLLQPTSRSLKGADLRDYMAGDADREAFSEHVRMKDGQTAQADVFHARLRDSSSSGVAMEFFTVGFQGRDGGQHHIVGMREHTDIQPLACQQRAPPPPPVPVVLPRAARQEGPAQVPRGTPSAVQHWDLRSHRSGSAHGSRRSGSNEERAGSDSDSDSGHGADLDDENPGTRDLAMRAPFIKTAEIAKVVTTNYLLMSWVLGAAQSSFCCPKHAAVASLQQVAAKLAESDCNQDYGPTTEWQCRRCGIRADEHRDPRRRRSKKCLICRSIRDVFFEPRTSAGGKTNMAL